MMTPEEIVERTFYMSLLSTAIINGLTLDPDNYSPVSDSSQKRLKEDMDSMGKFIHIFGIGNNQSRGPKIVPRITLELQGYYPSTFGINTHHFEKSGDKTLLIETDSFPRDTIIDVHLVTNNQEDMRLLHSIMYTALPSRGYIKPFTGNKEEYYSSSIGPTNNMFIEIGNFYDKPDLQHGLIEKVYSYTVHNGVLPERVVMEVPTITDISMSISPNSGSPVEYHTAVENDDTPFI